MSSSTEALTTPRVRPNLGAGTTCIQRDDGCSGGIDKGESNQQGGIRGSERGDPLGWCFYARGDACSGAGVRDGWVYIPQAKQHCNPVQLRTKAEARPRVARNSAATFIF